jgi:hypothetical protein
MVHLTLAGLSEDGKRLLLVSDAGVEFTLDVDTKLRAALRGDSDARARLGQLEIKMESILRPRDIQARIRAGETPETVAAAAQTTVEKIMPYAAPVLAEREHVAQRAQRASIRRPAGSPAGSRTLGDAVSGHLRAQNVDPGGVDWDAWRREDGRWTLTAAYSASGRDGEAAFTFDAPGNYVSADDDDARWLIGDGPADPQASPAATPPQDDLASARRRRLAAVPPDELPLGEDAIDLVSEPEGSAALADSLADDSLGAEAPVEAYLDDPEPLTRTSELDRVVDDEGADDEPDHRADHRADEPPGEPARAKRKGRASVPSWDEIMFGGGKHD